MRAPRCRRDAAAIVADLAAGVHHAHVRGVLHRDLKPSNVLLSPRSASRSASDSAPLSELVAKVSDFGLAKLLEREADETRSGTVLGTPQYMAPEQAEGRVRDVGVHTDVHALGVVLYELLAGAPPYRGQPRRILCDACCWRNRRRFDPSARRCRLICKPFV